MSATPKIIDFETGEIRDVTLVEKLTGEVHETSKEVKDTERILGSELSPMQRALVEASDVVFVLTR
ncbi:hypothetical protein MRI28_19550 [Nocardiopsis dassonvillei]|uniref:hypothetical protein n=1 Tax=Nocardiopsis dassonvillei TaxID=2014 RepID=UPI00200EB9D0|nr:hypothetical protein [Nocardiopsis dassonvillei]MCK9871804.1 hypothetical protein [Nocardiopsis dassonvillei]